MKLLVLSISIISLYFLVSCSSSKKMIDEIREISYYCGNVLQNENLNPLCAEDNIRYGDLIRGKVEFEFCHYAYPDTKELARVKFSSATDDNFTSEENFYYKDGELIYAEMITQELKGGTIKNRVFLKDGSILYKSKGEQKLIKKLVQEGQIYLTAYKASL